ncbi:MAG: hypothetical protein JNK19_16635 [Tabrizicola sp.]|nr:hypothetical protein [Tabrizicola sp.]
MIRIVLLLLALGAPAVAQTARVLSGEHGEFTRLVVELPEATGWIVGRTPAGYALAVDGKVQPSFDLGGVWQRIDRARLGALAVDPATGALQLQLSCDCHVFPFEYRPGVVVLDIKPGPPPAASVFEADFAIPGGGPTAVEAGTEAQGYDWLALGKGSRPADDLPQLPLALQTGTVSLEPLRDELLEQIARGAADGLVDMELPGKPVTVVAKDHSTLPWSSIRIGEMPGIEVLDPDAFVEGGQPPAECTPDAFLDLAAWGEGKPAHALLAEARTGLFGEFDVPDPEAVLRSVRQLLYLGFGAEALQHAEFLDTTSAELDTYRSMARIIDTESDPQTPFAPMLGCDGPAALWAALARDRLPFGREANRDAILRGFLALPPHLRSHLGPELAEKLLAVGDADAARMVRDAIERAPQSDKVAVALLDASADLHGGDTAAAIAHAEEAQGLEADNVDSLVTLVEAHFRKLDPVGTDVYEALHSLQRETAETALGPAVDRALVLSLALSGQTEAAFRHEAARGAVLADLWRVAQVRASDDDFLRQAVLPQDATRPEVADDVALGIAERLMSLGFPDAALVWINPVGPSDSTELRLLAARAELGRGAARAAVLLLDGLTGPDAEGMRAEALVRLNDLPAAATAYEAAGDPDAAVRLALWEGDWSSPDPETPAPWLDAAAHLAPAPGADVEGLLARSSAVAARSVETQAALESLLSAVPSPGAGSP